jgi:hypothetical protein
MSSFWVSTAIFFAVYFAVFVRGDCPAASAEIAKLREEQINGFKAVNDRLDAIKDFVELKFEEIQLKSTESFAEVKQNLSARMQGVILSLNQTKAAAEAGLVASQQAKKASEEARAEAANATAQAVEANLANQRNRSILLNLVAYIIDPFGTAALWAIIILSVVNRLLPTLFMNEQTKRKRLEIAKCMGFVAMNTALFAALRPFEKSFTFSGVDLSKELVGDFWSWSVAHIQGTGLIVWTIFECIYANHDTELFIYDTCKATLPQQKSLLLDTFRYYFPTLKLEPADGGIPSPLFKDTVEGSPKKPPSMDYLLYSTILGITFIVQTLSALLERGLRRLSAKRQLSADAAIPRKRLKQ